MAMEKLLFSVDSRRLVWGARVALFLLVCGCGGGGGSAPALANPANRPAGSGQSRIDMVGRWLVTDVAVLELSALDPSPITTSDWFDILPNSGGSVVLAAISDERVDQQGVEFALGIPVSAFMNQGNGATLEYAFVAQNQDRRVTFGLFIGAVDPNLLLAEFAVIYEVISAGTREVERYLLRLDRDPGLGPSGAVGDGYPGLLTKIGWR